MEKIDGAPPRWPSRRKAEIGIAKIEHFSWKAILDFYTCTECGRCSDNCPAHKTGKILSPEAPHARAARSPVRARGRVRRARDGAGARARRRRAAASAPTSAAPPTSRARADAREGAKRAGDVQADRPRPQRHPPRRALGLHHLPRLRGAVPGDDHVRRQDRRHAAQPGDGQGRVPARARRSRSRRMEVNGNPWNLSRMDRAAWADGLGIPTMAEKPDAAGALLGRLRRELRRPRQEDRARHRAS